MILALHLSIVQATTWMLVLLDTLGDQCNTFRGLLHINATRELALEYSMRW